MRKKNLSVNRELSELKCREAYKTVRNNITYSFRKDGCKKIAFVSSGMTEDRTKTAANTAIEFAHQMDIKVLMVECDLRCPQIHNVMKIKNVVGLTNYLNQQCSLETIIQDTEINHLKAISCGRIPKNPSELLMSAAMTEFVHQVEKDFDYLFFDVPPISIVTDVIPILRLTDGVVIVAKNQFTTYPELKKTKMIIEETGAPILGVVINGINAEKKTKNNTEEEKYYHKK